MLETLLSQIVEVFIVFLTCSVKFLPGPFAAVNGFDFNYLESVLITSTGGVAGVLFFYLISGWMMERYKIRKARTELNKRQAGTYVPERKFTTKNKLIIKIKKRFGLLGLVLITPPLLSIPIGSILVAKFFRKSKFSLPALVISVFFWSFTLTAFAFLFPRVPH